MTASQKSRTTRELMRALRFGVIGLVGFLCDAAILTFMTHVVHTNALAGRAVSAPIAILLTFLGHRHWSFVDLHRPSLGSSLAAYVSSQCVGFLSNFAIYCLVLLILPSPIAALTIASAVAMFVNYVGARFWAFNSSASLRGR